MIVRTEENRGLLRVWAPLAVIPVMTALLLSLVSCGKKEEQEVVRDVVRPVKVMTVVSGGEAFQRRFPGRVRASKRVELAFQVGGPLIELPVEEGQEVEEGQLIARIDPRDFESNLRNAQGQLAKARAARQLAQTEYDRVLKIQKADAGAVSQAMVDRRREAVNKAQADISSLRAAADATKDQLSYTYLKAPFSGVISKRYVENFQDVRPKEPIVSLDDISYVEVLVDLPEVVMARVKSTGAANAFAEFAAAPGKQYPLTLKEYATRADPRTQTYQVTLQMPQPEDINVLPGMTATVAGSPQVAEAGGDRFVVPGIAVFSDASGVPHVWVVDTETNTVQKRQVTTGELTGTESIEILDGLQPHETIAVSGVSQLREGMTVRPVEKIDF
jgi:RND family efflux transporter MFP subunit